MRLEAFLESNSVLLFNKPRHQMPCTLTYQVFDQTTNLNKFWILNRLSHPQTVKIFGENVNDDHLNDKYILLNIRFSIKL